MNVAPVRTSWALFGEVLDYPPLRIESIKQSISITISLNHVTILVEKGIDSDDSPGRPALGAPAT